MNIIKSALERAIEEFKIGAPIKDLFHPTFELIFGYYEPMIRLTVRVPDADGIKVGNIPVSLDKVLPAFESMEPKEIYYLMRQMLHEMLCHEVDESIRIYGTKAYDPHGDERSQK